MKYILFILLIVAWAFVAFAIWKLVKGFYEFKKMERYSEPKARIGDTPRELLNIDKDVYEAYTKRNIENQVLIEGVRDISASVIKESLLEAIGNNERYFFIYIELYVLKDGVLKPSKKNTIYVSKKYMNVLLKHIHDNEWGRKFIMAPELNRYVRIYDLYDLKPSNENESARIVLRMKLN